MLDGWRINDGWCWMTDDVPAGVFGMLREGMLDSVPVYEHHKAMSENRVEVLDA